MLSPPTVTTLVNRAMAKAGARDRAHLVVLAYRTSLVHPRMRRPGPPGRHDGASSVEAAGRLVSP